MFRKFVAWFSILSTLAVGSGCMWTGGLPDSYKNKERYPVVASVQGIRHVEYANDLQRIVTTYEPTNVVVLDANTVCGWVVEIQPTNKPLEFVEFLILPAPDPRLGQPFPGLISLDRTTLSRQATLPAGIRYISNNWGMRADDPLGNYRLVIFLDDKCAADFNFQVVETFNPAESK